MAPQLIYQQDPIAEKKKQKKTKAKFNLKELKAFKQVQGKISRSINALRY